MTKRNGSKKRKPGPRAVSTSKKRQDVINRYLVVTEGCVTEPTYFTQINSILKSNESLNLHIDVKPKLAKNKKPEGSWKSDPKSVVEYCIQERDKLQGKVDSLRDSGDLQPYRVCFAVVDVDKWDERSSGSSNLRQAMNIAIDNGIYLIISNLKFEVWLLWHKLETVDIGSAQLDEKCKKEGILVGKNIVGSFPYKNYSLAIRRALKKQNLKAGVKGNYPSTSMPTFFEILGVTT